MACAGEGNLADAGDRQRIGEAGEDGEEDRQDDGGAKMDWSMVSHQIEGGDDEVDQLDADERHDEPAEAVDEEVAAKQRGRADRAIGDAAQRQRDQRDDDQRVEDDGRQDRRLRRVRAP